MMIGACRVDSTLDSISVGAVGPSYVACRRRRTGKVMTGIDGPGVTCIEDLGIPQPVRV